MYYFNRIRMHQTKLVLTQRVTKWCSGVTAVPSTGIAAFSVILSDSSTCSVTPKYLDSCVPALSASRQKQKTADLAGLRLRQPESCRKHSVAKPFLKACPLHSMCQIGSRRQSQSRPWVPWTCFVPSPSVFASVMLSAPPRTPSPGMQ
jgi:hypothetical protein